LSGFAVEVAGGTLTGETKDGIGGVPLVLVHGFGGSRRDWEPVVRALPAGVPIVAYDQRGFGASAGAAGHAFSHADDLIAMLDALKIAQVDLCGVSLGGATVLGAALAAPKRVRRLVLVSPMLAGWSWSADWIAQWKEIGRAARAGDTAGARALWFDHPLFASVRAGPQAGVLAQAIADYSGRQWVQDDQRAELPMVEQLHTLTAPTLLLTGGRDLPDFRLMADLIEGATSQVHRIDYADAGHMLTLERPGAIAGAIAAFLQGQ
jgi:2-succinyl-6-hydroxy-2,4-cyclohexadiene-1-carboxylate synthase